MGECPCWSDEHYEREDGVMVCGQCGVAKCPTCDGDGEVCVGFGIDSEMRPGIARCPDCGGTGEAPEMVAKTEERNDGR